MKTNLILTIALALFGWSATLNAQALAGIDQEICTNQTTLNGSVNVSCTAQWTVLSGSATFTCPTCTTTTVTVSCGINVFKLTQVWNGYYCSPPTTDTVIITRYCTPTPANAGNDQNKCGNGNFTLAGNTPTTGAGIWSVISGAATINNPTSPTSTVSGIPSGSSATLRWTISNRADICPSNISTDDVVLTNTPLPTTANSGNDQNQCNNSNFTLMGNTPSVGTGTWSVITGTANIANPSSPTSSVTGITAGNSATLRWTISNGVCAPSTDDVILTNNPVPNATAGSNSPVCEGTTLNLTSGGGTSYSWTGPNGYSSTSQNPSIGNIIAAASGTYTVTVTANGCSSTATISIIVYPIPTVTAIANSSTICSGTSTNLSASGAATYSWTPATGLSNANIANPIASPTITTTYTVTGTANGCSSTASVTVTVNPVPSLTLSSNSPLCDSLTLNLTANFIAGATYLWAGPNGFSSTSQSPSILMVNVADSGWYSCTITGSNGCSKTDSTLVIVSAIPHAFITTSGSTSICQGDTVVLTATPGTGYLWNNNATSQSITVDTAGTFYCMVISPNGCNGSANTPAINVTVNPPPDTPTITQNGNTLACSESNMASYVWTIDGDTISTCTSQFCTCTQNGFYSVFIANTYGCSSISALYNTTSCEVGIESISKETEIQIFPNPTTGRVTINIEGITEETMVIKIYNILGKTVYASTFGKANGKFSKEINLEINAKGIYFLQVKAGEKIIHTKLMLE